MLTAGSPVQIFFLLCDNTSLPGCYFAKSRDAAINRYLILIDERVNGSSKEKKKIKPRCYVSGQRATHLPNRWGKKIDEARNDRRNRVKGWWRDESGGMTRWNSLNPHFTISFFPGEIVPPVSLEDPGRKKRNRTRRYRRKEKTHRS